MQLPRVVLRAVSGVLAAVVLIGMVAGAGAQPRQSRWYVGGGAGVNWPSRMEQEGHNLDTTCYPDQSLLIMRRHDIECEIQPYQQRQLERAAKGLEMSEEDLARDLLEYGVDSGSGVLALVAEGLKVACEKAALRNMAKEGCDPGPAKVGR